jgi:hypothetical protein
LVPAWSLRYDGGAAHAVWWGYRRPPACLECF